MVMDGEGEDSPLRGVRVLELTTAVAGPFFGTYFSEHGADVIRLESLRRPDALRNSAAGWIPQKGFALERRDTSPLFNSLNNGKRSIVVDLSTKAGQEIFDDLVRRSDVLVTNLSAEALEKLGCTWARLHRLSDRLIYVTLTSFGMLQGPYRNYKAWGRNQAAAAGLDWVTGWPDRGPAYLGVSVADYVAALHGVVACLAALDRRAREQSDGVHIDVSQFESMISAISSLVVEEQVGNDPPQRNGNRKRGWCPHGLFPTSEEGEFLALAVRGLPQWTALCDLLGRADWASEEVFSSSRDGASIEGPVEREVERWSAARTGAEAAMELQRLGIPAAPVLRPPDLLRDPHLRARKVWRTASHRRFGRELVGPHPIRMSSTDRLSERGIPSLGQHTREVLVEILGMTPQELERCSANGSIFLGPSEGRTFERPYIHWVQRVMDLEWPVSNEDPAQAILDRLSREVEGQET